jgi:hypothetical protein
VTQYAGFRHHATFPSEAIIHAVKLFLDNTGLHRAHLVLRSAVDEPVFLSDAMALLHLAEHIMFSDELAFSTFETNAVTGMSQQIKEDLDRRGYTSTTAGSLISARDFTEVEFAGLCDSAVFSVLEDLGRLQKTTTLECALKLAGTAAGPFGGGAPRMEKWISRSWKRTERLKIKERALERKASGACDYILTSNDQIYHMVRELTRKVRHKRKLPSLASVLEVVIRVALNDRLAHHAGFTYSPAPQRAKLTHEVNRLFRQMVEAMIMDAAHERGPFASEVLERLAGLERLPLPLFAIHYLREAGANSPESVLEHAITLRHSADVRRLRTWLNRTIDGTTSRAEREREIEEIKGLMNLTENRLNLFSLAKIEWKTTGYEQGIGLDPSGLSLLAAKFRARLSHRSIFLAALKHELMADHELGGVLYSLIGRQITTTPPSEQEILSLDSIGHR